MREGERTCNRQKRKSGGVNILKMLEKQKYRERRRERERSVEADREKE